MQATIPYPGYSRRSAAAEAIEPEQRAGLGDIAYRAGLSPQDVPEQVEIEVGKGNRVAIRFYYSNNEPPEQFYRRASSDGLTQVLLGARTRKVLEVVTEEAQTTWAGSGPLVELPLIADWTSDLPADAYKTGVRNAALVASLLERMPATLRRQVVAMLSGAAR